MQRYWKSVLAGGILLGSMIGLSTAASVAYAENNGHGAAVLKAEDHYTKYLCQKWYSGHWCTVYTTYSYEDAMDWYDNQNTGARVIAQK